MCGFLCVFRAFPVYALCSRVFSFLQSLPPPPFLRSNSFRCSNASSMLSLCVSSVLLYPSFLSPCLLLFASLAVLPSSAPCVLFPLRVFLVFLLRVLCPGAPVFLTPVPSTLCRFVALPSFASVRSVSLVRLPCFSCVCPLFRRVLPSCSFPLYLPTAFFSSSFFISVFSFPFSPLFSSPSFSIKKKVFP